MNLQTRQFGHICCEPHEVIHLIGMEDDSSSESPWLLLADKMHPDLFWLQSTRSEATAFPVYSLAHADGIDGLPPSTLDRRPRQTSLTSMIALVRIRDLNGVVSLDLDRTILIDPTTRRGIRLAADGGQALQHAPSEKAAPLRECA